MDATCGSKSMRHSAKDCMAGTTGLEPATSAVTGQRSNQLNYVPTCAARVAGTRLVRWLVYQRAVWLVT